MRELQVLYSLGLLNSGKKKFCQVFVAAGSVSGLKKMAGVSLALSLYFG